MTPAPISVERLRATIVFNRDVQSSFPHMETDPEGQYVRHSDYAALLQQLAEAERARDEATGLLRECDTVAKLRGEYGVADCIDNDGQPYQSAHLDAFLAASGGK